ncbi:MAG: transglutaminase-like domain-containing protein [Clostridium sp.]|uniref:transglutaminase-like domain-containing protein n=1 Tax=Clostridium sp. TaxID=1506 RepID=UPI0032176B90
MRFLEDNNINIVSLILIIAFIYPIIMGIIFKFRSKSLIITIRSVLSSIAAVCSIMLTTEVVRDVVTLDKYGVIEYISSEISSSFVALITESKIFMAVILLLVFLLIYKGLQLFIYLVSRFILFPISDVIDKWIRDKGAGTKALIGGAFQIPKSICYVIIVTALISYGSLFIDNGDLENKLSTSNIYNYINSNIIRPVTESEVAKNIPNILENSFRIIDKKSIPETKPDDSVDVVDGYLQGLIFYNGITLDEGIKSNEIIDNAARSITNDYNSNYDKSKAIYKWIGSTIIYDDDKAKEVMLNEIPRGIKSGAINTFNTGRGVCFDYACLYVVMCRANDIPVRLIVGEGFNGNTWISHSWNEVYISERDQWIKVDPTFYNAGNFFDSTGFDNDHRDRKIAGEWK